MLFWNCFLDDLIQFYSAAFTSQYSKEPGISGFFWFDSSIKHSEEYSVLRCFLRYRRLFYAIS